MSAPVSFAPPSAGSHSLRLSLIDRAGERLLDGGWWPRSRDLIHEMSDLAQHFPRARGRIMSAEFSRPDWDTAPRKVDLGTRTVLLGTLPEDQAHVFLVRLDNRECLTLLVIPPRFTQSQGEEALLAAATVGNRHSGADVLWEVTDGVEIDPADEWVCGPDAGSSRSRARG